MGCCAWHAGMLSLHSTALTASGAFVAGVAEEVLQLEVLDHGTRSIKNLCKSELAEIAELGMFKKSTTSPHGSLLWSMLQMMSRLMYAETQGVEGLNSIIKLLGRRSPNISLELLSSRLTIKHMLGRANGAIGCGKKFSEVKSLAEKEIAELTDFAAPSMAVLADAQRWAPALALEFPGGTTATAPVQDAQSSESDAKALPICDMLERGLLPGSMVFAAGPAFALWGQAVEWARSYNLGYKWSTGGGKQQKQSKVQKANLKVQHTAQGIGLLIIPSVDRTETEFYIVTDRFSHSVCFSRLRTFKRATDSRGACECIKWVHDGSNFADSIESTLLFGKYFHVCKHHSIAVRSVFLSTDMCQQLFTSPGYLLVEAVVDASVELFAMTGALMKGVATKKRRARPKAKGKAKAKAKADAGKLEAMELEDNDSEGGDADDAYMDAAGVDGAEMQDDMSEGEAGEDNSAQAEEMRDNDIAAAHADCEVERGIAKSSDGPPTAREVAQVADAVSSGCVAQTHAEIEEEALLLLVRQRNEAKLAKHGSSTLRLEGVGDADMPGMSQAGECQAEASAESASDVDEHSKGLDITRFMDATHASEKSPSQSAAMHKWAFSCVKSLRALNEVAALQRDHTMGQHRSISLVLMSPGKKANCSCVRCRWGHDSSGLDAATADLPELLWVTWLETHASHGVLGRRARHVNLDSSAKVLYCTADTRYARTGLAGGLGHPEILCDEAHANVIIPYIGAAMRKVRKTSAERDQVPDCCLLVRQFYETLIYRMFRVDAVAEELV